MALPAIFSAIPVAVALGLPALVLPKKTDCVAIPRDLLPSVGKVGVEPSMHLDINSRVNPH